MSTTARIDELRKKFEENPRRYFAPLANEYRKTGELAQAIALCREHLPKQPGHMSGYIVFGQALFEAGELDEARSVFEQALDLDPENLIALGHLGNIAEMHGDRASARRWWARVLDADPRNDDIAARLAGLATGQTPVSTPAVVPNFDSLSRLPATPPVAMPPIGLDAVPTPDSVLRAVDMDAFSARPPRHSPIDLDAVESPAAPPALPTAAPSAEPEWSAPQAAASTGDDPFDFPSSPAATDAADQVEAYGDVDVEANADAFFEEGLAAPQWPDTADLVSRIVTPRAFTPPVAPAVSEVDALDAMRAFGREAHDPVEPIVAMPDLETAAAEAVAESRDEAVADTVVERAAEAVMKVEPSALFDAPSVPFEASVLDSPIDDASAAVFDDAAAVFDEADEPSVLPTAAALTDAQLAQALFADDAPVDASWNEPAAAVTDAGGAESATVFADDVMDASADADAYAAVDEVPVAREVVEFAAESVEWDAPAAEDSAASVVDSTSDDTEFAVTPTLEAEPQDEDAAPLVPVFSESVAADAFAANAFATDEAHERDGEAQSFDAGESDERVDAVEASDPSLPWIANTEVSVESDESAEPQEAGLEEIVEAFAEDARSAGEERPMTIATLDQAVNRTPSSGAPAFVTETMAELLVSQGFIGRAVDVYQELVRRRPADPVLSDRLLELRTMLDAAESAPLVLPDESPVDVVEAADASPAEMFAATPEESEPAGHDEFVAQVSDAVSGAEQDDPWADTFAEAEEAAAEDDAGFGVFGYVTPSQPTPVFATPVSSATPSNGLLVTPSVTPYAQPAIEEELRPRRSAREWFAELAARRVPRRTPPHAAVVVESPLAAHEGLGELFGVSASAQDDAAARALADAFAPVSPDALQDGDALDFEYARSTPAFSPAMTGSRTPVQSPAFTPPAVDAPPSFSSPTAPSSDAANAGFAFDKFFPDPAMRRGTPAAASPNVSEAPVTDDLAQFSAWLKGLGNT
jgi:hypothetical protein